MCYYSSEGRSRDARDEEVLLVKRQHHGTNWLVSPDDPSTAVCLRDGTHLELLFVPQETQAKLGLPSETKATFRQHALTAGHQDILVLAGGRTVPLQALPDGQVIKVASVPPSVLQEQPPARGVVERFVSALVGAR